MSFKGFDPCRSGETSFSPVAAKNGTIGGGSGKLEDYRARTFSVCPYRCKKVLFSISVLCLASFAPEHDLPVQAVLQITLFWYHIDLYL